jgi:hypothetical protein
VITPSWSFDDRREERIPPSAPAWDTKGGIRRSTAGTAASPACLDCSIAPAAMSSSGVSRITGVIWSTIRRTSG